MMFAPSDDVQMLSFVLKNERHDKTQPDMILVLDKGSVVCSSADGKAWQRMPNFEALVYFTEIDIEDYGPLPLEEWEHWPYYAFRQDGVATLSGMPTGVQLS